MTKNNYILLLGVLLFAGTVAAQPQFKFSGYLQGQYQYGGSDAKLNVGGANEAPGEDYSRFGLRKGRVKLTIEEGVANGVLQLDFKEKDVYIKDAYFNLREPYLNIAQLRAGIFDRPFGNEVSYSSSNLESPERSLLIQNLFPEERDLGAMLSLQATESSPLHFLKLDAGLFAGNGIKQETDSRRDLITHLYTAKPFGDAFQIAGGVSYYRGSVYQGTSKVYEMKDGAFSLSDNVSNIGKYAKREYIGIDAQASLESALGTTRLRAEYIMGQQPATLQSSKSPNASTLPAGDTYIRPFSGAYAILIHDIAETPLSAVVKYDYYDPNTDADTPLLADLQQSAIGVGMLWNVCDNIRLQAYYEMRTNEKSADIVGWENDRDDNVFTLRLQYKF